MKTPTVNQRIWQITFTTELGPPVKIFPTARTVENALNYAYRFFEATTEFRAPTGEITSSTVKAGEAC